MPHDLTQAGSFSRERKEPANEVVRLNARKGTGFFKCSKCSLGPTEKKFSLSSPPASEFPAASIFFFNSGPEGALVKILLLLFVFSVF